jgi:hypothetical protein
VSDQSMTALQIANRQRQRTHRLRVEISSLPAGESCPVLADALEQHPAGLHARKLRLWDVLLWANYPRGGRLSREARIHELFRVAGIRDTGRLVGDLTDRQRHVLAAELRERQPGAIRQERAA